MCRISTDGNQKAFVVFRILGKFDTKNSTALDESPNDAIKLKNIRDGSIISLPRILSQRDSKLFFEQSIALDTATHNEGAAYTQYILIRNKKVKKLTLRENNDGPIDLNNKIKVFKIDHLDKSRLIVFFPAETEVEINYKTVQMQTCTADNLLAKNSFETLSQSEKAALVEVIHKYGKLYRASYPSASVTGLSDDSCPEVPKTLVTTRISNKTVAIFSSTLKSKICYAFVVGNFL